LWWVADQPAVRAVVGDGVVGGGRRERRRRAGQDRAGGSDGGAGVVGRRGGRVLVVRYAVDLLAPVVAVDTHAPSLPLPGRWVHRCPRQAAALETLDQHVGRTPADTDRRPVGLGER